MTGKADFTPEEWDLVREGPTAAGMVTLTAEKGGMFQSTPNLQSNLWGDDPFPAVDSNWDQPGRSFVASLNQTIGTKAVNTLQFSYSANKITVTRTAAC